MMKNVAIRYCIDIIGQSESGFDRSSANDAIAELAALEARIAELAAGLAKVGESALMGMVEFQRVKIALLSEEARRQAAELAQRKPGAVERFLLMKRDASSVSAAGLDKFCAVWNDSDFKGPHAYYGDTAEAACAAALEALEK